MLWHLEVNNHMEHELTLQDIVSCLKRTWWIIVIFTVVAALLAGLFTHFFITKTYASSVDFYIVNTNTSIDYNQTSTLQAADYLVNDYVDIIKGDRVLTEVSARLEEEGYGKLSNNKLAGRIDSSSAEDSSIFTLTVTDTSPERAQRIAEIIAEVSPAIITEIAKPGEIKVSVPTKNTLESLADTLDKANNDKFGGLNADYANAAQNMRTVAQQMRETNDQTSIQGTYTRTEAVQVLNKPAPGRKVSPSMTLNCALGGAIAAVITFIIILLRTILNTIIRTEEDIKKSFKYPVIGTIPTWGTGTDKSGYAMTDYHRKK